MVSTYATPGLYSVIVYNKCFTVKDSIKITGKDCSDILIPNVFTPNSDGVNDAFILLRQITGLLA